MNEQAPRLHDSRGAVLRTETNAKTVPCGNDARVLYKINLFRGKSGRTSGADQLRTGDLEVSGNVIRPKISSSAASLRLRACRNSLIFWANILIPPVLVQLSLII